MLYSNQIKVTGLASSLYYYKRPRMSACDGEVWTNQDALEQADRLAYICSVTLLSKNCRVIQKPIVIIPKFTKEVTCANIASFALRGVLIWKYKKIKELTHFNFSWMAPLERRVQKQAFKEFDFHLGSVVQNMLCSSCSWVHSIFTYKFTIKLLVSFIFFVLSIRREYSMKSALFVVMVGNSNGLSDATESQFSTFWLL